MDYKKAELEILEALDSGEISKDEAKGLLGDLENKSSPVIDEMHPGIDFTTRLVYKNFGADSDASFNYLQKKHPELNFKKDASGEVLAKAPGESSWRRLDPTGFDLQDITDVGYDVLAGVGEGAAAVTGGLVGGAAGLPSGPGAIATGLGGAALAGGAAGGGLEALRNQIGQFAGIEQEQSLGDIGTAAAFGAASPLLLGTGAGAKQVAKQALKSGLDDAGKAALKETQRGLLGRTKSKISSKVGQFMSGVDSDTLEYMSKNLDKVRAAEQSGTGGAEIYGELREQIQGSLQSKLDDVGRSLGETQGAEGIQVSIKEVEKPMVDLIKKYEEKALKAIDKFGDGATEKVDFQNYEYVRDKLSPYLTGSDEVISGYDVKDYLDNLNEVTQIAKNPNMAKKPKVDKDIIRISRIAADNLDKQASSSAAGSIYKDFKSQYGKLKTIEDKVVNKWFKDDQATERTLNSLLSPKKKSQRLDISKAMSELGVPVNDTARESVANSLFVNPNMDVLSSMGTTSTSRSVPLGGLGGFIGYGLGSKIGDGHGGGAVGAGILGYLGSKVGSPATMRKFAEINEAGAKRINKIQSAPVIPYAPNIQSGFNIIDNINRSQNGQ